MNPLTIFLYEWKHLSRSPFKLVAMVLFIIAAIYALHSGAALYKKQDAAIEQIREKADEERQRYLSYYDKGEKGPEDRPWIDMSTPFWAVWNSPTYHFKTPSPAMVYSIGQAEQYGFYKRVTYGSSPYDADMAEEIANPERLQSGTLDFSFVVLYLLPLLLLICLYNIKGAEADAGFLPLVFTQTGSQNSWLLARVTFYGLLILLILLGLMLYGAGLTSVFPGSGSAFLHMFFWLFGYLLLWGIVYALILQKGMSSISNTLKMVGVWLLFAFIIPATVHQWVSIQHPSNLMTEWIDAQREESNQLYDQADSVIQAQLNALFPDIVNSPVALAGTNTRFARNRSIAALSNELVKKSVAKIESSNEARNDLIRFSYWFNPVTFMQNKLNDLSQTHYQDYQSYRTDIQSMVDMQIQILVLDLWNDVEVDKKRYLQYQEMMGQASEK
ncbi:MAG: hypothetical protein AAF587_27825 [Bacteroidota bacterium]